MIISNRPPSSYCFSRRFQFFFEFEGLIEWFSVSTFVGDVVGLCFFRGSM